MKRPISKPENIVGILEGSKTAFEEEIRELWATALRDELIKPGSVSQRTSNIIKLMTPENIKETNMFLSGCFACGILNNNGFPVVGTISRVT